MRLRNYIGVIVVLVFILYLSPMAIFFVPIAFWEYPILIIAALVGFFLLNTIIEYGVLYDTSRPYNVDKIKLLRSVTLINLFTFPVTYLSYCYVLACYIRTCNIILYVLTLWITLKITGIIIEWIFYKSAFQKLLSEERSTVILTSKTVFSISVIVNTISFLVIGIIHVNLINAYLFH